MCDCSLQNVKSRSAAVGDKLVTHNSGSRTRGFAAPERPDVAVCLLPGTEIAFPNGFLTTRRSFFGWPKATREAYHSDFPTDQQSIPQHPS